MNNILDRIEPREDGVYFLVDYKKSNPKEDIVEIVKKYSIKDFDPSTIDKVIEESSKYIFITKDKDAINIDEKFDIIVSKDRMLAEVKFKAPFKNGNVLSKQQILDKISESNVVFGLDFSDIENFICNRDYNKSYVIAKGIQPEESKNGFLEYHVDISKKTTKPKVLEDGTLDYRELNMFESVHKDQTLVTRVDAIKGADGRNVYDEVVPSKLPKEAPTLAQGKNTRISEDGKLLLSNIDGCVAMKGKTVNILPVLEIESDVDTSIGNIDFIGSILIKGNVLSGFTVSAGGDIDILGVVEDSNIIANGNISIAKGVQGGGKARIIASENINLNFVENATIICEKDITASSIMHSDMWCGGNVNILGDKGVITGGKSIISGVLSTKYIGAPMSSHTDITVGINYRVLNKYEELVQKVEEMSEKYNKLERIVKKLSSLDINSLSKEKRILFEKSVKEKLEIKKLILVYKKNLKSLMPYFTSKKGMIKVTDTLYNGTKVVINNAVIFIKEDLRSCTLRNIDGKIEIFM